MDIQISLERGEYVKKRAEFMKTLEIPKLSNAVSALGSSLAQIVFDECDEALKEDFGLAPPLNGAGDELWVSPSDLLIGKVALKPPLTKKHVQALTHQGILRIGQDIEVKFWNEMEMEKERALAQQKKRMLDDFEDKLNAQLRLVEMREQTECAKQKEKMTHDFEARLLEQLNNLQQRLKREFAELSKQQELQLREEFNATIKKEVEQTVQNITKEFLAELARQKYLISKNFKVELQKTYTQKEYELRLQQFQFKENLRELKHNLECKNLSNMMYILCMERRKCCDEKAEIEKHFEIEINLLNDTINLKDQEIRELADEKNKLMGEVHLRETCLTEIIKQFQKFINFALRAAPTQAEFLLSVDKMLTFELTDAILKSSFREINSQKDFLPWYNDGTKAPETVGLEIMDHHDCLNEINPPIPPGIEMGPEDFLPAFNYGEKLYVREDFRNMVSQGIRLTKSSTLWSKDVEILMDTLQQSISQGTDEEPKNFKSHSPESNIQFKFDFGKAEGQVEKENISIGLKDEIRSSIKPNMASLETVDFSKIGKVEDAPAILATTCSVELMMSKGSVKFTGTGGRKESGRSSTDDYCVVHSEKIDEPNIDKMIQVMLKHSENSVNVIKRRGSTQTNDSITPKLEEDTAKYSKIGSKQSSPRESLVLDVRDSIILRKSSLARKSNEFNVFPNDSIEVRKESSIHELRSRPSKLVTTKNSLELLRESKIKIADSSGRCPKKPSSKFRSNGSSCAVTKDVLYCEKCLKTKDDSIEVIDGLFQESRQGRKDSLRVSHVEVFDAEGSVETNVAFNTTPIVYDDTGSVTCSINVSEIYKHKKNVHQTRKKKSKPQTPKDKFLNMPAQVKVLGDIEAKEFEQTSNEFTMDRVKSFITILKDNQQLMRTFTACAR